ncbi:MAG TPA: response regulator [Candidatus Acidoferrales bacterium]|nr:response regulator [Candidatus Acidoferrales bacterium]
MKVKVLVVDDNALVLELISKGLEPHGEIRTASDGADALLKIVDDTPDLVLCDYRMPGLDGRQLYEKLRSRFASRPIPFIFLSSRSDMDEKLRPMVDGVEEFIVKPFFVHELVRRAKKVIDRLQLEKMQKTSARPGVIQGRLEEMSMLDLMQSIEMGQKTCKLTVRNGRDTCEIYFAGGQCQDAQMGKEKGEPAVYEAIRWPAGEFEIDFNSAPSRTTIERSTTGVLMEAMRLMDESQQELADQPNAAKK